MLPVLRTKAPEHYATLPHHTSWVLVILEYIADPSIGPFSRVKRDPSPKGLDAARNA